MKKEIIYVMAAGLLLLAACEPKEGVGPVQFDNDGKTPTPIVVPTCTPTATPSPVPGLHTTAAPTNTQAPTATAAPTETPTPMPTETPTPGPEPTPEPTATTAPTETLTPSPEPTPIPTATAAPTETPTPMPTETPTPSPEPTPTINPEPLVANGWQKTVSIDETYMIVFPEVFRNAEVSKTDRELVSAFYSDEHPDTEFKISYIMQQSKESLIYDILTAGGSVTEDRSEEQRTTCMWQVENTVYHSVFIDVQYPQSLLGTAFGEDEWIAGVMQVVFSYPADIRDIYETEQYSFHVVYNGEE